MTPPPLRQSDTNISYFEQNNVLPLSGLDWVQDQKLLLKFRKEMGKKYSVPAPVWCRRCGGINFRVKLTICSWSGTASSSGCICQILMLCWQIPPKAGYYPKEVKSIPFRMSDDSVMLFWGGWSRNHIFIVFEGLSSSQIVLRVDKTLHESVFTRFGQGDLILLLLLFWGLGGHFTFYRVRRTLKCIPKF